MTDILRLLLCALVRALLSLRYRIEIDGLEKLKGLKQRVLVAPNHPGLTDPLIIMAHLWPRLRPRPMLYRANFDTPLLRWIMRLFDAVEVPTMVALSIAAREGAKKAVRDIVEGLRRGENHLMWPAGRIYRKDREDLGAASGLVEILSEVPAATIVAVRTKGLWGSMFGFAQTGESPDFGRCVQKALLSILTSLVFFAPRRRVRITVERWERGELPGVEKELLKPFFEKWYNEGGPETAVWVPYHALLGPRTHAFPAMGGSERVEMGSISPAVLSAVVEVLERKLKRKLRADETREETSLEDLGLDSLGRMELALAVEQRFGFTSEKAPTTFGQVAALANGTLPSATSTRRAAPPPWSREPSSKDELAVLGETVAEAFVTRALATPRDVAAADDISGVVTYERLLTAALVMAKRVRALEGENVGLMLPASVATTTMFMAIHLAGRLPVMLNWTTGPANLAHAAKSLGVRCVITSRRFIDRTGVAVEGTRSIFMEDLRRRLGRLELLATLLEVKLAGSSVAGRVPRRSPGDTAVVLFTSGSEKAPKGVPLTHGNLVSNIRGGIAALHPTREDSLLSFLPPFHSFGLTAAVLLPLLGGMKAVYHADPTDATALAHKAQAYMPTVLFSTPTFLSYILDRAAPGDLASLRLVVTGAEKCPPALTVRMRAAAPDAVVLEGYGITECSPIISVNRRGAAKDGTIGLPLPGVTVQVVSHDTFEPLGQGEMGMLLVHGPNVFPGYVATDAAPPFVERDGKRWYVTGDLVRIDGDGFIVFSGRLGRFIKAAGEMVSLPALEEPFTLKFPPTDEGPRVAVEGVELDGGRTIVLFTTEAISVGEANEQLAKAGLRGVLHIDEVVRLEKIPVLGTGKTDYKVLRAMISP